MITIGAPGQDIKRLTLCKITRGQVRTSINKPKSIGAPEQDIKMLSSQHYGCESVNTLL